jgi:hypothetical protein
MTLEFSLIFFVEFFQFIAATWVGRVLKKALAISVLRFLHPALRLIVIGNSTCREPDSHQRA